MAKFKISLNGEETELEAARQGDNLRVTRDGQTADLHIIHTDGRHFLLEHLTSDGKRQRIRAAGHVDGDKRHMWVNGRSFTYKRLRQTRDGPADDDSSHLSASIPAVVADILVNVGDQVESGDKLLLLESMKMIIPIQAQFNGVIASVNCAVGDSVQPGVPLINMEENG